MAPPENGKAGPVLRRRSFWLLVLVLGVHLLMGVYDVHHPGVFLNADRAISRWADVEGVRAAVAAGTWPQFLATKGNPGDYAVHAMLDAIGGRTAIVVVQVLLLLASGAVVYRLACHVGVGRGWSRGAACIYFLMPHNLVLPHQLASEAIHSPLIAIATWLLVEATRRHGERRALISGLLNGVATLVRPVSLLWPLLAAAILSATARARVGVTLAYLLGSYLLVAAWFSFMGAASGTFGMGASARDAGHNLHERVGRIVTTLPKPAADVARERYLGAARNGTLSVGNYLAFAIEHPAAVAAHSLRDGAVLLGKSGIERVLIDYLEFSVEERELLQDARAGWRHVMETEGVGAAVRYLWRTQGTVLVVSMAGAALMLTLAAFAVIGAVALFRGRHVLPYEGRVTAMLLVALPLYISVFSQAGDAVQSRHRAPAEFAIVVLAVVGMTRSFGGRESRSVARRP